MARGIAQGKLGGELRAGNAERETQQRVVVGVDGVFGGGEAATRPEADVRAGGGMKDPEVWAASADPFPGGGGARAGGRVVSRTNGVTAADGRGGGCVVVDGNVGDGFE